MNLKPRRNSFLGLNDRDMMTKIRIINSFNLNDEVFFKKYYCDRDTLFNICLPSYKKSIKEKSDIKLISLYLANLKKFMTLLKNINEDNTNNTTQKENNDQKNKNLKLLKYISENIEYESFSNKRLIMRFGDLGNKFYIILNGLVSILIPARVNLQMTFLEYSQYIASLLLYKEFELAKIVMRENKLIYRLDLPDMKYIINYFYKNNEEEEIKLTHRNSNGIMVRNLKSEKNINININKPKKLMHKISIYLKDNNQEEQNLEEDKSLEEEYYDKIIKFMKMSLSPEQFKIFEGLKKEKKILENDDGIEITPEIYINRLKSYKYNNINYNISKKERANKKNNTSRKPVRSKTSHHDNEYHKEENNTYYLNKNKNSVYIYEYQEIIQLETGDMFGDMALSSSTSKRTATIISASDCHFGCLDRDMYNYIKFSNDKKRKNIINYISRTRIFKNLKYKTIEEKYINYFAFKNCVKDEDLIKIGEVNPNIILIKSGKFEINVKGGIISIFELINYYKNNYIDSNIFEVSENIIRKINKININKNKIEKLFKNNSNDIICKLFVLNSSAIFGFKETERQKKENFSSFFEIKCSSSEGEYVLLDKRIFYRQIYSNDFKVKEETHLYIKEFIDRTIDRLIYILYSNIYHMLTRNDSKLFKDMLLSNVTEEKKGNKQKQKNLMTEFKLDYDYMNKYNITDIEFIIDIILNKYNEEDFDNQNINVNLNHENYNCNNIKGKNTIILDEEKYNISQSKSIFNYLKNKNKKNLIKSTKKNNQINNNIINNRNFFDKEKINKLFNKYKDKFKDLKYKKLRIKVGKSSYFSEEKKMNLMNDNKSRYRKKINNVFSNNNMSYNNEINSKSISFNIFGKTNDSFISDVNINYKNTKLGNACVSRINYIFNRNNSTNNFETSKANNRPNLGIDKFIDFKMRQLFGTKERYSLEFDRCFSAKHNNNSTINIFENQLNKDSYSESRQKYILKHVRDVWTRNRPIVLYKRIKQFDKNI